MELASSENIIERLDPATWVVVGVVMSNSLLISRKLTHSRSTENELCPKGTKIMF